MVIGAEPTETTLKSGVSGIVLERPVSDTLLYRALAVELMLASKTAFTFLPAGIPSKHVLNMVCSRHSLLVFVAAGVWLATSCTAASKGLSAAIKRYPGMHVTFAAGLEGKTCTDTKGEITVQVAADETEATFKCGGTVTALYPADCNGDVCPDTELARRGDQKVQRICEDAECGKIKALNDVFPGATRDDSTGEHVHVLKFPKEDRPQKDVWYQCRTPQRTNPCKVKISVAAALKDPPAGQICSQDNSRVTIEVGKDTTEARFKCGDTLTTLDPEDCSGDSCQEEVAHDNDEPVSMIYEDESCSTAKHLDQVFPGATRHDDATNHVYKLTIPKEGRTTKAAWYQCKGSERNGNTLCKVKINVTAALPTPPTP
ncbi:SAG-related sequence SRS26A, partial [Toxoplasma gondii ARI]